MKTYPITIQPNPRSPHHYRGRVMLTHFELEADGTAHQECRGYGRLTVHWWSWSPRFWWNIFRAWLRPQEEIDL